MPCLDAKSSLKLVNIEESGYRFPAIHPGDDHLCE